MIKISIRKKLLLAEGYGNLDIDTEIEEGGFTTLFGKSGAGKTTLLRILAGLVQPEKGIIEVKGNLWLHTERKINLPVQKREIGFVFQDFALFPNMTVKENLQYAVGGKSDPAFIESLLKMVSLTQLAHRKPATLSGGQQQRAALIRALVRKPKLLLLDEPLSALDIEMRVKLREEILLLHKKFATTTLMVSHDLSEIYRVSDRVIVIEGGKIVKMGSAAKVFSERQISSKIQMRGEVLSIIKSEVVYIVEISVGNTIVKIIATEEEIKELKVGESVMVISKAFNPIIIKIPS